MLPPGAGYPMSVDLQRASRLQDGYRALVERGDSIAAEQTAAALLAQDAGFHAARVLLAQARFLAHDFAAVVTALGPVAAELPQYGACQLLLGRAEEELGNLPAAYAAYRATADLPLAAERAAAILPAASVALAREVVDAAGKGRTEAAAAGLVRLMAWAPEADETLEASAAVARAKGDLGGELVAVRRLAARRSTDRALLERRGELESEVGDPAVAMQVFEGLLEKSPGDGRLRDRLAEARFRWRLELLPSQVRDATRHPQTTRADLALLLYWLVPEVRYGRPAAPHIATDVLDHPAREEIVRVINLGLLDIDETVHRFLPERSATRIEMLAALDRILARRGARCAAEGRGAGGWCAVAVACGVLPGAEECLPSAPLSGSEAVRFIRRAIEAAAER